MFSSPFRALAEREPGLVLDLWEAQWSGAGVPPGVAEMTHLFDVLPLAHSGRVVQRLETTLIRAIQRPDDESSASVLLVAASGRLLKAFSATLWQTVDNVVFHATAPATAGLVDLTVFALTYDLMTRDTWRAQDARQLCGYGPDVFRRGALAGLIANVFRSPGMRWPMLGTLTLEWRNRCIQSSGYPLPDPNTEDWITFSTEHAIATILSVGSVSEVVAAVRGLVDSPGGCQVLNCVVVALANHDQKAEEHLSALAADPVQRILRDGPELSLAMPPTLASCVSPGDVDAGHLVDLMLQGQRFVSVHVRMSMSWMESYIGYVLLLLRTGSVSVALAARLRNGSVHNSVVRALLLSRTLSVPLPTTTEAMRVPLVILMLVLVNGAPHHTVLEAVEWLAKQPLRVVLVTR